jgi:hypothetical protein
MYIISATIEGGFGDPDVLCAFDPNKIVARLRLEFPGMEVDPRDFAWRDFDNFVQHGVVDESGALGIAARDARRRGPVWKFQLLAAGGKSIRGTAERHTVYFLDEDPFPEPVRSQLVLFAEGLRFAPCVTVKCVQVVGNDEHPA